MCVCVRMFDTINVSACAHVRAYPVQQTRTHTHTSAIIPVGVVHSTRATGPRLNCAYSCVCVCEFEAHRHIVSKTFRCVCVFGQWTRKHFAYRIETDLAVALADALSHCTPNGRKHAHTDTHGGHLTAKHMHKTRRSASAVSAFE